MSRDLNVEMTSQKDAQENKPVELYIIMLDEVTLYLTNFPKDIDFYNENGNAQTYTATAIKRNAIDTNVDTKVDEYKLSIDNVNLAMSGYSDDMIFTGRTVIAWEVFRDSLDNFDNKVEIFKGTMDSPEITQHSFSVTVTSNLDALDRNLPNGNYQVSCRFKFGGKSCEVTVPTSTGTIDSIDGLTVNSSDMTESDDYWNYGFIIVGNEQRFIENSTSGSVTIEYPFENASAGDNFELEAGCDKTLENGHGCTYWSNSERYGGFLRIPKIRDVRNFG